jgi:hypothetical protein
VAPNIRAQARHARGNPLKQICSSVSAEATFLNVIFIKLLSRWSAKQFTFPAIGKTSKRKEYSRWRNNQYRRNYYKTFKGKGQQFFISDPYPDN